MSHLTPSYIPSQKAKEQQQQQKEKDEEKEDTGNARLLELLDDLDPYATIDRDASQV